MAQTRKRESSWLEDFFFLALAFAAGAITSAFCIVYLDGGTIEWFFRFGGAE